jgi:hypothetical protein
MKSYKKLPAFFIFLFLIAGSAIAFNPSKDDPWRPDQLMEPQTLNNILTINQGENLPVIFNVGPVSNIKGAISVGASSGSDGLASLQAYIKHIAKDKVIVIYCGCCPLFKCPNVRPAFKLLTDAGYTNIRVLKLQNNLKTDWINMGYPVEDK